MFKSISSDVLPSIVFEIWSIATWHFEVIGRPIAAACALTTAFLSAGIAAASGKEKASPKRG
jgi:hypothetical protein